MIAANAGWRGHVGRPEARPVVSDMLPSSVPAPLGGRRIAPSRPLLQGDSGTPARYSPGVSDRGPARGERGSRAIVNRGGPCLTPFSGPAYDPPDEDAPGASERTARLCASRGSHQAIPGPMERIARQADEADVPAQETSSRQGTRLPRPDEDGGRSTSPRRATDSGSEATDGLTNERGTRAPRLVTISRPTDFAALQRLGTARSHSLLYARFLRTDLPTTRFGLSTGRKLGGAVVRNRVRRRLREALRAMAPAFQPGWDVLIVARPAVVDADHRAIVGAVERLLRRGGVIDGAVDTGGASG